MKTDEIIKGLRACSSSSGCRRECPYYQLVSPTCTQKMTGDAAELIEKLMAKSCTVIECCPHCDNEATVEWDLQKDGYEMFCPYCGEKIMLCSECPSLKNGGKCDWSEETGCSMKGGQR